jgi:signal transduction histidine kinase
VRSSLQRRLTIAIVAYTLVAAAAIGTHGYRVNEGAEHLVWQSLLESELAHFVERQAADPHYRFVDTDTLKLYGPRGAAAAPAPFASLGPGVHDEVRTPDGLFVVLVSSSTDGRDVLALDISDVESRERTLTYTMILSTATVAAALAVIAYFGVGWLVRPLSSIARAITSFAPNRSGQRVAVDHSAPREAEVIALALNDYLRRIDAFVDRERAFVNTASHELRTPLAVIAGAAEVALETRTDAARQASQLRHILGTARGMERLVALLLALAKEPARLRAAAETVDLGVLIPEIVRDHAFLAERKELTFRLSIGKAAVVQVPEQIARAAIGNLLRNAVENSARGVIDVIVEGTEVTIQDPGQGMSAEELSAVYARLARSGDTPPSTGIGLELIGRICDHLGWRLHFSSVPGQGTRAVLDLVPEGTRRSLQDSDTASNKL